MKNFILTLSLLLVLIFQSSHIAFSEEEGKGKEEMTEEQIAYVLKNDDALLKLRKIAADQLFKDLNGAKNNLILETLQISKKTDTAKLFRVYLEKKILESRDPKLLKSLRSALENRNENSSFRNSALSILWQVDPESISPTVFSIIEDISEPQELRVSAMERLVQDEELVHVARKIVLDKREQLAMRRACLDFIESRMKREEIQKLYQDIILDTSDQTQFRRFLVMKGARFIENLPDALIKVVSNSKNDVALRQTALYGLYASKDGVAKFLPEIRRLVSDESSPVLKENLKEFIEKVEAV